MKLHLLTVSDILGTLTPACVTKKEDRVKINYFHLIALKFHHFPDNYE